MRYKKPKTEGLEFLYYSMNAFNGSGYADKTDGESYAESYVKYKQWKKLHSDAGLALSNWEEAIKYGEKLCLAKDGQKPNEKNYQKFLRFCRGEKPTNNIDNNDTLPLL